MTSKKVFFMVSIWRLFLSLLAICAGYILSYKPSFPYGEVLLAPLGPKWLSSWGNFDGVHYLTIVNNGYVGTGAIQAFFPLYPYTIKALHLFITNPLIIGVIVSTVCFGVALYYLYKLILLDESHEIATKAILLLMFFPTAFFFTSLYAESLFLLEIVMCFYAVRKKQFGIAAFWAALASATKVTGILLVPALIIDYFASKENLKDSLPVKVKTLGIISLGGAGLVSFMMYLQKTFGDWLFFIHVQTQFGVGRQVDKFVLLYQVFWRYCKMLATVSVNSPIFYTIVIEFLVGTIFFGIVIYAFWKVRTSYAFFALCSFLVPTLTGTFTSLPRYVLVLFPAFIVLAKGLPERYYKVLLVLFGILLSINTVLFIQGYWVA